MLPYLMLKLFPGKMLYLHIVRSFRVEVFTIVCRIIAIIHIQRISTTCGTVLITYIGTSSIDKLKLSSQVK